MEFELTTEQQRRYDRVRDGVSAAFPGRRKPGEYFTAADWVALGELGVLGACVGTDVGGRGYGALDSAVLIEAFGRGCPDFGLVFAASAQLFACAVPIDAFGQAAVRERYLPPLCAGLAVAGNAMTEPQAGSDVAVLQVDARAVSGGYVLNGDKSFVSNGPAADVLVTYATTDATAGHLGQTAFVVDAHADGVVLGDPFEKMGLDSCPAGSVTFTDCFVPESHVLGVPGAGGAVFQHSMSWERTCLFAGYVGMMDRLVDACVAHARERRQYGRRLADFQAVSHRIAGMKARLESARLLLHRACVELDRGAPTPMAAALSKLVVSEAAVATALDAIAIHGSRGYLTEYGIESALRAAIPGEIFSGTSDIQREIIARELGL